MLLTLLSTSLSNRSKSSKLFNLSMFFSLGFFWELSAISSFFTEISFLTIFKLLLLLFSIFLFSSSFISSLIFPKDNKDTSLLLASLFSFIFSFIYDSNLISLLDSFWFISSFWIQPFFFCLLIKSFWFLISFFSSSSISISVFLFLGPLTPLKFL